MIRRTRAVLARRVRSRLQRFLQIETFPYLRRAIVELNSLSELMKVFRWSEYPILEDPVIHEFQSVEDVNERRIRDFECLGAAARNLCPRICVDLGTSTGHSAALMAANAPQAEVITVNIPPEDLRAGGGGDLTTVLLEREEIGCYYRAKGFQNIRQVLADTAQWEPDTGPIDLGFVDACHDAGYVYNDSRKLLQHMASGSLLLWHDFNLDLIHRHGWIREVCAGVEQLLEEGLLTGPVFHVRDSWVGIYQVSFPASGDSRSSSRAGTAGG